MKYLAPIISGIIVGQMVSAMGYEMNQWQTWAIFIPVVIWVIAYGDIDNYFKNK